MAEALSEGSGGISGLPLRHTRRAISSAPKGLCPGNWPSAGAAPSRLHPRRLFRAAARSWLPPLLLRQETCKWDLSIVRLRVERPTEAIGTHRGQNRGSEQDTPAALSARGGAFSPDSCHRPQVLRHLSLSIGQRPHTSKRPALALSTLRGECALRIAVHGGRRHWRRQLARSSFREVSAQERKEQNQHCTDRSRCALAKLDRTRS
mmetsp:Transcript_14745/g.32407  ORF Transcript_14745/g.32407 Transcript_14745/m.32407 type:complete len:206 (-) Transcript_14745:1991-2608(-)